MLDAEAAAVSIRRSDVRWTGGHLEGRTCIAADRSRINLFAVTCAFRRLAFRLRASSKLFASASVLRRDSVDVPLHGSYERSETQSNGSTLAAAREGGSVTVATCSTAMINSASVSRA